MTQHHPDPDRQDDGPDGPDRPADTGPDATPADASIAPPREAPTPGVPWRLALFLGLTMVVVIFAVQNTQDVVLEFLGWSWRLPLVIVVTITVVVSVILDEVLGGIIKRRQRRRRLEREELKRLREQR